MKDKLFYFMVMLSMLFIGFAGGRYYMWRQDTVLFKKINTDIKRDTEIFINAINVIQNKLSECEKQKYTDQYMNENGDVQK